MIAVTLLAAGAIVGAFYWGNAKLQTKAADVSSLQTDLDVSREKIIALRKAQQTIEKTDEAERILNRLLPATKSQETLVADIIYTATKQADIPSENIGALTFTNSTEPNDLSGTEQSKEVPGVYSYPFNMTIQNISFQKLIKLLQEIENNGRLVQIDTLQISPDKTEIDQISSVSLTLKAFLKP